MNYEQPIYVRMCKMWLYLAKRFNPEARIIIFYKDKNTIQEIKEFSRNFTKVKFARLNVSDTLKFGKTNGWAHPCQELKFGLWKYCKKKRLHKFIQIDADAFILSSLQEWWSIIEEKPFIAIPEYSFEGYEFFNAGVHSYFSRNFFLTYKKLIDQYHSDNDQISMPSGEQGLMNAYFKKIGYHPNHSLIGFEYNCLALNCKVKKITDDEIIIYSGNYPWWKKYFTGQKNAEISGMEKWLWWNKRRKVKILHAFGSDKYKFWNLPECEKLWSYLLTKIHE